MLTQEFLTTSTLNNELREFAEEMPVVFSYPTFEEAVLAIKPHFPELVKKAEDLTQLLDDVGIVVVEKLADLRISWSVADNSKDAEDQLSKYSQPVYSAIRKALNINHHWVVKVDPDFLGCSDDGLMDGYGIFRADGSPECWILDLS
jgi:hypothetical protein